MTAALRYLSALPYLPRAIWGVLRDLPMIAASGMFCYDDCDRHPVCREEREYEARSRAEREQWLRTSTDENPWGEPLPDSWRPE